VPCRYAAYILAALSLLRARLPTSVDSIDFNDGLWLALGQHVSEKRSENVNG
jgi:hypothetical protein